MHLQKPLWKCNVSNNAVLDIVHKQRSHVLNWQGEEHVVKRQLPLDQQAVKVAFMSIKTVGARFRLPFRPNQPRLPGQARPHAYNYEICQNALRNPSSKNLFRFVKYSQKVDYLNWSYKDDFLKSSVRDCHSRVYQT